MSEDVPAYGPEPTDECKRRADRIMWFADKLAYAAAYRDKAERAACRMKLRAEVLAALDAARGRA